MRRIERDPICVLAIALVALAIGAVLAAEGVSAREIHIAKTGSDASPGDRARPFLTINRAASVARPGDIVTVHAGTYREWVKPVRGGTGENRRITYRAAPGEKVAIKGSERITSWKREAGGVWKVELPDSFFGEYNPYALKVTGGWLNYGQWHHRGDVYLDGEAFYEKETVREVPATEQSWHCQAGGGTTTIRANFGKADPNRQLTEINVRESLFLPEITGLMYITVDGFHFLHAAANWAPPVLDLQTGAVGPRMGKHWIIQNCTVVNARCVGIILGQAPGVDYSDIDAFGDHIVRNNVIRRCGQAGIAGQKGATRSVISGNFIEDTNYRREFGGWETAGIKLHNSVDTVIRGNLIRGVYHETQAAYGIWMDFGNQGIRITGNVICDTETENIFLEMNHGPVLVDNNVLIGGGFKGDSENNVFAHNLLVDCGYSHRTDLRRRSQYYKPHTTRVAGRKPGVPRNEKWYRNIFIRRGLDGVRDAPGHAADYNVFLEGARRSSFGDEHSVVDAFRTDFERTDRPLGVTIGFTVDDAPFLRVEGPWVDAALVGVFPTCEQTIEDRHGKPIVVDGDFLGSRRTRPIAGPLAGLKPGRNTIVWSMNSGGGAFAPSAGAAGLPWAPEFGPGKDVFEVSASTYAWEVHDEGVENMLDNMQQMAGVNSVYLIALMHYEARPHRARRFPHNPVRRTWLAEDSCIYWHPELSMYGRIRPERSRHEWLNETDWLEVVTRACRRRNLKVGVEISHTVLGTERLKSPQFADVIQRNLRGEPARIFRDRYVPCPSNPDVLAYLVALFSDLARNHDIDYLQTCMVHFAGGEPSRGGCFCAWCGRGAAAMGYDMAAMKEAFRRDPRAQPYLGQWIALRRKTIASMYRTIIDAVHEQNPRVDFRLNHWTRAAARGGMYVEDIVPMLDSIRLMSYHEQNGDPGQLPEKRQWIADTIALANGRIPTLAAMGVRDRAYPDLIVQGVGIAISEGVQGITLGHYDAAAFSILRAIRNGLAGAGVRGLPWVQGIEVEAMELTGFEGHRWAYETCARTAGEGTATQKFHLESGRYDVKVGYADQEKGNAELTLLVEGKQVDSWKLDGDTECWLVREIANVPLKKGDSITIAGKADGNDQALVDFIEFIRR